jgi:ATP-dependent Clp protease ATP-binding subunit ClpA
MPYFVHSLWNIFTPEEYRAICDTMYYRDELVERIRDEWQRRNRTPTKQEIDDAQKEVEEKTKEIEEALGEAEEAIIEEIERDGEFSTELNDEARHNLRELVIKDAGQYIRSGGISFDEWVQQLQKNLPNVFLEESPEKIAKLLQNEKVRESLRKVYDMADRDLLHHPPSPGGLSPLIQGALHSLQHLLGFAHHHDHHHPPKGTTLRSIIFFIIGLGALLYYLLTNDDHGAYLAMAIGPLLPIDGGGDQTDIRPKPELLANATIDLKEYIKERKIRDYYFSSEVTNLLDTVAGRSSSKKTKGHIKNNVLLTAPNSELLEYIMESTVSGITGGEDSGEYSNLKGCDFLLFNAARIVDAISIPGTIEDMMAKLRKEIDEYYKDKGVILFINFQDLYDLGQMEGRRGDAIAGIYMRLAGLLESKNVTVVGLASDFLAKKIKAEERMMQYMEVIPAEKTEEYRIGQIIKDELNWLNEEYKNLLGENKIKMKLEETRKLAGRLAKLSKTQEPPQILKNYLEKWFTEKFLRIEKLKWEQKYHIEQIEKLINEYGKHEANDALFDRYMHNWLEHHLSELERIKREIKEYEAWFKGISGSYWVTVDEVLPKESAWEQKIPGMKDSLSTQVVDQEQAVDSITTSFETAQIMRDKEHPIGAFIFVGPTGVGKTEAARALSRYLTGSEDDLVRIDGSEHSQSADIYKLIGPPPAIIGHEQGGTLTNEVAKREFCIVLYDELEKSHATIQDIFLQVIDGARLTDGKGKTVSFQNTVIIMTSNLGYSAREKSGIPPQMEEIKKMIEEEISKQTDDKIKELLQRIQESYKHLNETVSVFQNEIDNINKLLQNEPVAAESIVSLAAFKARRGTEEQKKQERRDYVRDFFGYYIDLDYGETFFDISTLQYYYACLNYYQDTKPLTEEDKASLEDTLKKIMRIYELDYRREIMLTIANGKKVEDSVVEKLKELQAVKEKTVEEKKQYFLNKMYEEIRKNLTESVRKTFRQEFLNKLGERNIITFSPLTKGALRQIFKLKLKEILKALAKDGYGELKLSDELEELVIKEGFRPDMGARPLIRALRRIVLEPLSEVILRKELLPDRIITAYLEDGKISFRQEQSEKETTQNGIAINRLLTGLKDGTIKDVREGLELLELQIPSSLPSPLRGEGEVEGASVSEQDNNKIDFAIKLSAPEEEDILKVDNNRLEEIEEVLTQQIAEVSAYVKQLEAQLRSVTDNSQKQILRMQIDEINKKLEFANGQVQLINLKKEQKIDDARKLQEQLNKKKQSEASEKENEINDSFENISIEAQNGEIEEQPIDSSAVYKTMEILKSSHRNDAFIIEASFIVQRNIVKEMVRRSYAENDPVLSKTRFLRLRLTKLSSSLSLAGAFEGKMRELMEAIHVDNTNKGIKTVIVIDIAEVQKEIERMRFNPFMLSFFLRLFHKHSDISFIMTSNENSAVSEDVFERYFKDLQIKQQDIDKILEALVLCSESWIREKDERGDMTIPFEIKQRALKIWRQFYSGEPPLETIREWIKGVSERRKQGTQDISRDRDNILRKISNRIQNIFEEMAENEDTEWTVEKLVSDKELISLLKQLQRIDDNERVLLRTKGAVTKEELDNEIIRQEKSRTDLMSGEAIDIDLIDINPEERALNLEANLNKKIFGQEDAIKRVSTAVKINTAGLRMRNQPVGSFLYGGPTGVGKTETAKQTAKAMGMRFFRIDMSEFKSREDVWKLLGAPRGYIGWDAGEGTFIDWMRKYPRSVILFDEVEKGHPDIFNLLLQVLEDGIITSNRGRQVDFSESIIFMTTNLGVKEEVIQPDGKRETVFDMYPEMEELYKSGDQAKIDDFNKRMAERVNTRISQFFRPELLNRLDAVEVFLPFSKEKMFPIAKKMLKLRFEQLEEEHGIRIVYDESDLDKASDVLKEEGFSPKSGAREIERLSRDWVTKGFRPILRDVKDLPRDTRVKFVWQNNRISFQIEETEEVKQFPEGIAGRVGTLLEYLKGLKGEQLTPQSLKELFYPMEAKAKPTEKKSEFTDEAVVSEVQGASPIKKDKSLDRILEELVIANLDDVEAKQSVIDWLKESIGLCKRLNLWRCLWEKAKKFVPDFWELGRKEINDLFNGLQEQEKLGDKKIEILHEKTKESILLGIKANSTIGKELQRLLVETEYESEDEIRNKLHKHKNLQGFAIAILKLKQAGIKVEFDLDNEKTLIWIKIPIIKKTKQEPSDREGRDGQRGDGDKPIPLDQQGWTQVGTIQTEWQGFGRRYPGIAIDKYTGDIYVSQILGSDKEHTGFINSKIIIFDQNGNIKGEISMSVVSGVINDCFITRNHIFIATGSGVRVYNKKTFELDGNITNNDGIFSQFTDCHTVVVEEKNRVPNKIFYIANTGVLITYDVPNKTGLNPSVGKCDAMWLSKTGDLILVTEGQGGIAIIDPNTFELKYSFRGTKEFWINGITDVYETEDGTVCCDGYSADRKRRIFKFKRTEEEFETDWYNQATREKQTTTAKKLVNIGTLDVPNENEPVSLDYTPGMMVGLSYNKDNKTVAIWRKGKLSETEAQRQKALEVLARMKEEMKTGSGPTTGGQAGQPVYTKDSTWQKISKDERIGQFAGQIAVDKETGNIYFLDSGKLKVMDSAGNILEDKEIDLDAGITAFCLTKDCIFATSSGQQVKLYVFDRISHRKLDEKLITEITEPRDKDYSYGITAKKGKQGYDIVISVNSYSDDRPFTNSFYKCNTIDRTSELMADGITSYSPKRITLTSDNNILVVAENTVKILNSKTMEIEYSSEDLDSKGTPYSAVEDENGYIYVTFADTKNIVVLKRGENNKLDVVPLVILNIPDGLRPHSACISNGKLIILCRKENGPSSIWEVSSVLSAPQSSAKEKKVSVPIVSIFAQNSGWTKIIEDEGRIGTSIGRINIDNETGMIYAATYKRSTVVLISSDNTISENTIDVGVKTYGCYVTDTHLYVATNNGIYVYDKTTRQLDTNIGDNGIIQKGELFMNIAVDKNGNIFVCNLGSYILQKYTPKNKYIAPEEKNLSMALPHNVKINQDGNLLVSYAHNICIVDPETMEPIYDSGYMLGQGLANCYDAVEDPNGLIYAVGRDSGRIVVFRRSEEEMQLEYFKTPAKKVKKLVKIGELRHKDAIRPCGMVIRNGELIVACENSTNQLSNIWGINPVSLPDPKVALESLLTTQESYKVEFALFILEQSDISGLIKNERIVQILQAVLAWQKDEEVKKRIQKILGIKAPVNNLIAGLMQLAARRIKPQISTEGRAVDSEKQVMEEIKDIAKRLAEVWDFIDKQRTFDSSNFFWIKESRLRDYCLRKEIPFEIIKDVLVNKLGFVSDDENDRIAKDITYADLADLDTKLIEENRILNFIPRYFKTVAEQFDFTVPEEFKELKDDLYRLLTLNSDGTPMERTEITQANIDLSGIQEIKGSLTSRILCVRDGIDYVYVEDSKYYPAGGYIRGKYNEILIQAKPDGIKVAYNINGIAEKIIFNDENDNICVMDITTPEEIKITKVYKLSNNNRQEICKSFAFQYILNSTNRTSDINMIDKLTKDGTFITGTPVDMNLPIQVTYINDIPVQICVFQNGGWITWTLESDTVANNVTPPYDVDYLNKLPKILEVFDNPQEGQILFEYNGYVYYYLRGNLVCGTINASGEKLSDSAILTRGPIIIVETESTYEIRFIESTSKKTENWIINKRESDSSIKQNDDFIAQIDKIIGQLLKGKRITAKPQDESVGSSLPSNPALQELRGRAEPKKEPIDREEIDVDVSIEDFKTLKEFFEDPAIQGEMRELLEAEGIKIDEESEISDELLEALWTILTTKEDSKAGVSLDILERMIIQPPSSGINYDKLKIILAKLPEPRWSETSSTSEETEKAINPKQQVKISINKNGSWVLSFHREDKMETLRFIWGNKSKRLLVELDAGRETYTTTLEDDPLIDLNNDTGNLLVITLSPEAIERMAEQGYSTLEGTTQDGLISYKIVQGNELQKIQRETLDNKRSKPQWSITLLEAAIEYQTELGIKERLQRIVEAGPVLKKRPTADGQQPPNASLTEDGSTEEATTQPSDLVLKEIKDIAKRLSVAFGNCFSVGFSLGNDVQKQREIFSRQSLPHEVFKKAISVLSSENLPADFDLLESFFGDVADIVDLNNMPELPEKLRKYKEQIYEMLTLNPDGTPMERWQAPRDFADLISGNLVLLNAEVPVEGKVKSAFEVIKDNNNNVEIRMTDYTQEKHLSIYFNLNTNSIRYVFKVFDEIEDAWMPMKFNDFSSFFNIMEKGSPVVSIGVGENRDRYVVLHDDFYGLISFEGEGIFPYIKMEVDGVKFEFISEREASYRGTIDIGFRKCFKQDNGKGGKDKKTVFVLAVKELFSEEEIQILDRLFTLGKTLKQGDTWSTVRDNVFEQLVKEFPIGKIDTAANKLKQLSAFARNWDRSENAGRIYFYAGTRPVYVDSITIVLFTAISFLDNTILKYLGINYDKSGKRTWGDGDSPAGPFLEWQEIKDAFYAETQRVKVPPGDQNMEIIKITDKIKPNSTNPDAYFGGMEQDEINPHIKRVLEDESQKDFNFIRGSSDEMRIGNLVVPREWEESARTAFNFVNNLYRGALSEYGVVVLKGVNFSGHYGIKRKRIYVPLEFFEAVAGKGDSPQKGRQSPFCQAILEDFIEHEYLHSVGWSEEKILRYSQQMRPGVYESAKELYRKYIAQKLVEAVSGEIASPEARNDMAQVLLRIKLEKILERVQGGNKIELSETQLHRLLWLIQQSNQYGLAKEIAELVNLVLEPNNTGNIGQVIMALEKEMLLWMYEQKEHTAYSIQRVHTEEKQKLLTIHINHTGDLRFEGPELSDNIKNTINFMHKYAPHELNGLFFAGNKPQQADAGPPIDASKIHYVLIDEFRARNYKDVISSISKKTNVVFVTKLPDGVNPADVVVLLDPEDADKDKWSTQGFNLFMPMFYNEKGFMLAAWLSLHKTTAINDNPAFYFVKHFYEYMFNKTLTNDEVVAWFTQPWLLKDRIQKVSENINILRVALEQLDKAA